MPRLILVGWPGPLHSSVTRQDVHEALQPLEKRCPRQGSRGRWKKGLKFKCNLVSETFTLPAEMETSNGRGNMLDEQTRALVLLALNGAGRENSCQKSPFPSSRRRRLCLKQVLTQQSLRTLQQGRTSSGQSIPDGHKFKGIPHVFDTMQQSQLDAASVSFAVQTLLIH